MWIGTKGEDHVVECPVTHVVDFARDPFHANELIVAVIEPQVDTGNAAVTMLDALLVVNVDVEETEKDSFREALVEGDSRSFMPACFSSGVRPLFAFVGEWF